MAYFSEPVGIGVEGMGARAPLLLDPLLPYIFDKMIHYVW